jgi:hypothetical protein
MAMTIRAEVWRSVRRGDEERCPRVAVALGLLVRPKCHNIEIETPKCHNMVFDPRKDDKNSSTKGSRLDFNWGTLQESTRLLHQKQPQRPHKRQPVT